MAVLVLGLLILAMAGHSSANWCVCKQGLSDAILQKALDYACGQGADCNPIRPNGQCYNPSDVRSHCSYAVNSYYQKKASSGATCDFGGAATLSSSNPSVGSCSFSTGSGSSGTGGTGTGATGPVTTVPTTGTPTTTPVSGTGTGTGTTTNPTIGTSPTTTGSPYTTTPNAGTPSAGILGGVGLAPTGSSMDESHGIKLESTKLGSALAMLVISGIVCLWN